MQETGLSFTSALAIGAKFHKNCCTYHFAAPAYFYPVYREIDATVSECLVDPMFTSLEELINDDPDERDIETAAELITSHGNTLLKIRPGKCDNFIVALRTHLCEGDFKPATRRLILQVRTCITDKAQKSSS
ncbi:unnamed protein product [Acanthocheilonema viteae]|uniref:Uncharacterized protein n=1 Tax=Acanthocheilonema viteae TaxID=6277 RepID=A0A498SCZ5_ACAVI|nr:unnamed protein product [Acanthocheilonema viteae]